jgi:hypothetical protein
VVLEVHPASNRNEDQEYFLDGKDSQCVCLTTFSASCADCLEMGVSNSRKPRDLYRGCFTLTFTDKYTGCVYVCVCARARACKIYGGIRSHRDKGIMKKLYFNHA